MCVDLADAASLQSGAARTRPTYLERPPPPTAADPRPHALSAPRRSAVLLTGSATGGKIERTSTFSSSTIARGRRQCSRFTRTLTEGRLELRACRRNESISGTGNSSSTAPIWSRPGESARRRGSAASRSACRRQQSQRSRPSLTTSRAPTSTRSARGSSRTGTTRRARNRASGRYQRFTRRCGNVSGTR